jgi:hypothetical protein
MRRGAAATLRQPPLRLRVQARRPSAWFGSTTGEASKAADRFAAESRHRRSNGSSVSLI